VEFLSAEDTEEIALRKIQREAIPLSAHLPAFNSVFPQRLPTAGRLKKYFDASGFFYKGLKLSLNSACFYFRTG